MDVYLTEIVTDRFALTRGYQILHDELQISVIQLSTRLGRRGCPPGREAGLLEQQLQRVQDGRVVVDDQDQRITRIAGRRPAAHASPATPGTDRRTSRNRR